MHVKNTLSMEALGIHEGYGPGKWSGKENQIIKLKLCQWKTGEKQKKVKLKQKTMRGYHYAEYRIVQWMFYFKLTFADNNNDDNDDAWCYQRNGNK